MIDLSNNEGIYLFSGPTDLRKSIDGLLILIQESFSISDMRNKIFMFSNKHKNRINYRKRYRWCVAISKAIN